MHAHRNNDMTKHESVCSSCSKHATINYLMEQHEDNIRCYGSCLIKDHDNACLLQEQVSSLHIPRILVNELIAEDEATGMCFSHV